MRRLNPENILVRTRISAGYSFLVLNMKLVKKILNKLNGLHYPQEYLCLAWESLKNPLHVYLARDKRIIRDITNRHVFAGYHPLIFAFPAFKGIDLDALAEIEVV